DEQRLEGAASSQGDGALADDGVAEAGGEPVDGGDRGEDQQNQERHAVPFEHADLLDQMQSDATGTDDADDGRGARVRFEEVEHLREHYRQNLRQQAEADLMEAAATGCRYALDRLTVGCLD